MDDDFEASQGADLLGLALGRQPGASDLDDFVDFEVYFDGANQAAEVGEALPFLRARLCDIFELLGSELERFLWHRDRFILEAELEGPEPHLTGHVRTGEGAEDEWFVVHLLRRLTTIRDDVSCRVIDADGEVVIIEAALAVPTWLTPANAENRCWIRHGKVQLLPKPRPPEPQQLPVKDALAILRISGDGLIAKEKVQHAIDARLEGYPKKAYDLSTHVSRAVLPEKVARLLVAYPQLISVILDQLPTPPSNELQRMRRNLPDDESSLYLDCESLPSTESTVCIGVRFTRLQYARLIGLRCSLPQRFGRKRWKLPLGVKEGSVSEKAMQLGAMLCAGLEAAFLSGPRSATAVLRWPSTKVALTTVLPPALPWWPDVAFQRYALKLQPSISPTSLSARRAFAQQNDVDAAFRKCLLQALQDGNLNAAVDLTEHWRDRDDSEEWLQVSQDDLDREMKTRQAEFDEFDRKRAAPRAKKGDAGEGNPSTDELQKEIAAMGSRISSLLQQSSGIEGVDPNTAKAHGTVTATTAGSEKDSDSEDGSDAGECDVLGMEDDDAGFGEDDSDDEDAEGTAEGGNIRDYMYELDNQLETILDSDLPADETHSKNDSLPLSSRHIRVHGPDSGDLDVHAMEHVLASFCSEHQLEPGPASMLLGELGLTGGGSGIGIAALDSMD